MNNCSEDVTVEIPGADPDLGEIVIPLKSALAYCLTSLLKVCPAPTLLYRDFTSATLYSVTAVEILPSSTPLNTNFSPLRKEPLVP